MDEATTAHAVFQNIIKHGRQTCKKLRKVSGSARGIERDLVAMRERGMLIREIAEQANVSERAVQSVMREHGLCRDQRREREYVVTVVVPEMVRVQAVSVRQALVRSRELYNENVRVARVEEVIKELTG